MTAHLSPAEIAAFARGDAAARDAAALEEHLLACEACAARLDAPTDDHFLATLRDLYRTPVADPPTPTAAFAPTEPAAPAMVCAALPDALLTHPRYRVANVLGRGGMGTVYRAEHALMGRTVALKAIDPRLLEHPGALARFRQEVRAAAKLHHPNIVTAYDAEQAGPSTLLVMEYVAGQSLGERLRDGGPLPADEACDYARQVALGLAHAHGLGMVHRDIKPHNLMLTPDGVVKVLDFGLARFVHEGAEGDGSDGAASSVLARAQAAHDAGLTAAGACLGTLDYMAPEQARDARSAGATADVYSLGATLYHLLAGQLPFPGGTALDKLSRIAHDPPAPLADFRPDLPAGLAAVVARMMAKRPEDRYPTASAAAAALARFCGPRPPRRRPWAVVVAAAAAAAVLVAVGIVRLPGRGGEVVISTDAPDVQVVVDGDCVARIIDPRSGKAYRLDRDQLTLGAADGDGVTVTLDGTRPVVLTRKGERFATVTVVPKPEPPRASPALTTRDPTEPGKLWLDGYPGLVWSVAYSPDGTLVYTTGNSNLIRDRTGAAVGQLGANGWFMTPAADGRRAVGSSVLGTEVILFDVTTRREIRRFGGQQARVLYAALSPDGAVVAAAEWDTLRTYDAASGAALAAIPVSNGGHRPLAFAPDGKLYVQRPDDRGVQAFDPRTGRPGGPRIETPAQIATTTLTPDGATLAVTTYGDGDLLVYDTTVESPTARRVPAGGLGDGERHVAFSADGRRAVFAAQTGVVVAYDLPAWREVRRWENQGKVVSVAVAPDGTEACCGCFGDVNRAFFLKLPTPGNPLSLIAREPVVDGPLAVHTYNATYSPDGSLFATCGDDAKVRLRDGATARLVRTLEFPAGTWTGAARFTPDGRTLLVVLHVGIAQLRDVATGATLASYPLPNTPQLDVAADGTRAAAGAADGTVRVFDVRTGEVSLTFTAHATHPGVIFSPDGRRLVTWSGYPSDRRLRWWDADGGLLGEAVVGGEKTLGCQFSPDGRELLVADSHGVTWYAADRTVLRRVELATPQAVPNYAISPDGSRLATVGPVVKGMILHDLRTGRELGRMPLPALPSQQFAFSPDGRRLAAGSHRGYDYLFGVAGGE